MKIMHLSRPTGETADVYSMLNVNFFLFSGIFILNLCCRDRGMRQSVLDDLKGHFEQVCTKSISEHVNEVVFGLPKGRDILDLSKGLPQFVTDSMLKLRSLSKSSSNEQVTDLSNSLRGLSVK